MVKIKIICEGCGTNARLKPKDNGKNSYIQNILNETDFYIQDININAHATGEIEDYGDISDVEVKASLHNFRITCKKCGEYIVLNDFDQY